jgi:hypothetical protein
VAGKRRQAQGFWLKGEGDDAGLEAAQEQRPPAGVVEPNASWNNLTMLLQTLRDKLVKQGWGQEETAEFPVVGIRDELARRRRSAPYFRTHT